MKKLAITINDWMVAIGLFVVVLFTLSAFQVAGPIGLLYGLIGLILWAIGSGLWCVLSGIHAELVKLNDKNA